MQRKFLDEELSKILGISVGNVIFTLEIPSHPYSRSKRYSSGIQLCRISFYSFEDLYEKNPKEEYGSIFIAYSEKIDNEYFYVADCLYGKETARIAEAVSSGLSL